jgi:uncharacterized membrane protein
LNNSCQGGREPMVLAFTIFGVGGIVGILILVLIIAAVVYFVRRA